MDLNHLISLIIFNAWLYFSLTITPTARQHLIISARVRKSLLENLIISTIEDLQQPRQILPSHPRLLT